MEAIQLTYDADDDRIYLGEDGLHCGDYIDVLLPDGWDRVPNVGVRRDLT